MKSNLFKFLNKNVINQCFIPMNISVRCPAHLLCAGMNNEKLSRRLSVIGTLKSGMAICFIGTEESASFPKRFKIPWAFGWYLSGCKYFELYFNRLI